MMNIPKLAINNYQIVCTAFFVLMVVSVINFMTTSRTEFPVMDSPIVTIIVETLTTDAESIETQFMNPLEEAINELEDIKEVYSSISGNILTIEIVFTHGIDIADKIDQTTTITNTVQNDLESGLLNLSVHKSTTDGVSILNIALVPYEASDKILESEAIRLQKVIRQIDGVKSVDLSAYPKQEIQVELDLEKLYDYGISFNEIETVLKHRNTYIPGGSLDVNTKNFNILTTGAFKSIEELKNTFIKTHDGQYLHLRDIASIRPNTAEQKWIVRHDGIESPILHIYQDRNKDVVSITKAIKEKLKAFEFQADIKLKYIYSQAEEVESQIDMFFTNLLQGLLLVCLILFFVLGVRSALIICLFIPLASFAGLMLTNFYGLGLNQMSIVGMIVSLGLLVDNSIAIVENIERLLDEGHEKLEACIEGVNQLLFPMTSSTLTTMAVFIPIIFMPDVTGDFIKPMPVVVLFTMLISLVTSIILAPVLCYFFLKENKPKLLNSTLKKIEKKYETFLNNSINNKGRVFASTGGLFLASILIFPLVGVTFFPKADKKYFLITVETDLSKNLDYTQKIALDIEEMIHGKDAVLSFTTSIGHGIPSIYYNMGTMQYANNYAEIFVETTLDNKKEFNRFVDSFRQELELISRANINIKEYTQGLPARHPIEVIIKGDNLEKLEEYSTVVLEKMKSTNGIINTVNASDSKALNLTFAIEYKEAAILGIAENRIEKEIRNVFSGCSLGEFIDKDNHKLNIKLKYGLMDAEKLDALKNIRLITNAGELIALDKLVSSRLSNSKKQLKHIDFNRITRVSADIKDNRDLDRILSSLGNELNKVEWEAGYSFSFKGDFENRNDSFGQLGYATIIAIFIILIILIAQYKSFLIPLIIIAILPLTIIGAILALWVTGQSFSFTAFVGLISLIGICINDSIILVDFSYELLKKGYPAKEAAITAAKTRMVPVLMTSITTIFGLIFLAFNGGSLWTPMSTTIIGGLFGTTLFVLILVPILFIAVSQFLTANPINNKEFVLNN